MSNKEKKSFHYGFMIVLACCAVCGAPVAMTFSCAGIFYTPVSTALEIGRGTFGVYITVLCLAMTFTLPIAGKIFADRNVRTVLSTCVIITALSFFGMSRSTSVYQFYVAGFFLGIANAFMLYLMTPTLINAWFKTRAGFFMGFCMAFTGVGGIIFNPIGGYIITNYGWRSAYFSFGIFSLVIALPFTLFVVRKNPAEIGKQPYGAEEETTSKQAVVSGVSLKDAMSGKTFYLVTCFAGLLGFVSCVNFYLPSYANSIGLTTTIGAAVASASMLGNIVGKVVLGYINDKTVGGSLTLGSLCGIAGLLLLLFLSSKGVAVFLLGGFLYGMFYAATITIPPMLTRTVFGSRQYSQIYSNIMMVSSLCSALGASLWGFISDASGGSFAVSFSVAICMTCMVVLFGWIALGTGKKLVWN